MSTESPPLGPKLAHRYTIVRSIGAGGMAEVLLARQRGLEGFEKLVVIKRILPHLAQDRDFEQMFLDEARTAADLRHSNIVQIYDVGHDGESYYIAMEYLHGVDLRELGRKVHADGERVPLGVALQIVIDAAAGLQYAHTKVDLEGRDLAIVHRDVSPHNIIVTFDGVSKLVDFGIAHAATRTSEIDESNSFMGKCGYLSPEQALGEGLDGRSDQFALAIVLYEITTGQRLFQRDSNLAAVHAVLECDIPAPEQFVDGYPPALASIIARALSRRPRARFADCRAFGEALETFLAEAAIAHSASRVSSYLRERFPDVAADQTSSVSSARASLRSELPMARPRRWRERFGVLVVDERASGEWGDASTPSEPRVVDVGRAHTLLALDTQSAGLHREGDEVPTVDRSSSSSSSSSARTQVPRRITDAQRAVAAAVHADERSASATLPPRTNLPEVEPIVGRGREVEELARLVQPNASDSTARLVTILGPGGMGKTRLSIEVGSRAADGYAAQGGCWFVDLSEAQDRGGLLAAVGEILGVQMTSGATDDDTIEQLGAAIAARGQVLLLLDNVEQIIAAASEVVAYWLVRAPRARFIATSRERLDLTEERVFDLGPLALPGVGATDVEVETSEAVQLFVTRARAVRPSYALVGEGEAQRVGRVVRELDGIPLAIELAAARMRVMTSEQLEKHLPRRFELLASGSRDRTARQATLRGAIAWSYRLLVPWEQAALRQVSVFRGGFTLEAADAVLDLQTMRAPWTLDALHALRDKSLIWTYDNSDPSALRFGLYISIREFADTELSETKNEQRAVESRHAAYYLELGRELSAGVERHGGVQRLRLLAAERDNLLAVLERALRDREAAPALEAVLALDPLLSLRGPFGEHREMLSRALDAAERAPEPLDPRLLGRAYAARGAMHHTLGALDASQRDFDSALALATQANDLGLAGRSRAYLAAIAWMRGDVASAQKRFEQALGQVRQAGDRQTEGRAIWAMGMLAQDLGQLEMARKSYLGALAIHREVGNRPAEGVTTTILANLYLEMGRLDDAHRTFEQGRTVLAEVGDRRFSAINDGGRAVLAQERADHKRAAELYNRCIKSLAEVGDRQFCGCFWGYFGTLAHEQRQPAEAARRYREGLSLLRAASDRRREGAFLAALGGAMAQLGERSEAMSTLDQAHEILGGIGDSLGLQAVEVYRALLVVDEDGGAKARAVLAGVGDEAGRVLPSDDLRIACRILRRALGGS